MNRAEPTSADLSFTKLWSTLHPWIIGRKGLITLTLIAAVGGMYFNWAWLVATGIAPLLLTILPCVAMCALGLCHRMLTGAKSCEGQTPDTKHVDKHTELRLQKTDQMPAQNDDIARRV